MTIAVKHLKTGWNDPEFEEKLNNLIMSEAEAGWQYYDLRISSKDNNCLVIFSAKGDGE